MEKKIKEQSENLKNISEDSNKKENELKNDISNYLTQINSLKNEL